MAIHPEDLSREELKSRQWEQFQQLLRQIVPANPFWLRKLTAAGFQDGKVTNWDEFRRLPITTKAELVEDHQSHPPYGSNLTYPLSGYCRYHQTSGTTGTPLRWLDTPQSWDKLMGLWAQIYRLAKIRPDDRFFFPFSFGPFIGFWAAFEGACREGYLCLPGGGLSSPARLKMLDENQATIVCCTPTYALRLAEVAEQEDFDLPGSSVRALIVAGEPGGNIPATRERIASAWGARVFDHWGMTEIGSLGMEPEECPGQLSILETECIAEIVDPQTFQPVPPGELGELLITTLGRVGTPLIRYRTGDLVRENTGPSADGRQLLQLAGGIQGRLDDMVIIRGNNVFPSSVEAVLRRYPEIAEFRITVEVQRRMNHLRIEIEPQPDQSPAELQPRLARAIRDSLNFQAEIQLVAPGTLPRFELKGKRFFRKEAE